VPVPDGLCLVNDHDDHWTWQPSHMMSLDTYKMLTTSTTPEWTKLR
jgi:hypothetical protein